MKHCYRYLHLILRNNILNNLFIVQKNIKGSKASNCMVVQFQILFVTKIISNSISVVPQKSYFLLVGRYDTCLYEWMQYLIPQCIPMTGRKLLLSRCIRPTEKNKLLKNDTLKTKNTPWSIFNSILKTCFLSKLVFTHFKCLNFSRSSILEFGRGEYNQGFPQASPDLSARPWLLRQQIWSLGKHLGFGSLTNVMLKWILCGYEGSYDNFISWCYKCWLLLQDSNCNCVAALSILVIVNCSYPTCALY